MSELVSPNDLFKASKEYMLEGREPASTEDWLLMVNFWVVNIEKSVRVPATLILVKLFAVPVTVEQVKKIIDFHNSPQSADECW